MRIIKNNLSNIGKAPCDCESNDGLPYVPKKPLPSKNFAMLISGAPASGKTNLLLQLLMSHPTKKNKEKPLYYYGLYDRIELISPSMATLPSAFLKKLPDQQKHMKFSNDLLEDIIESMYDGDNVNNLLVIDDSIRDISRSIPLSRVFLNRRHCTHNCEMVSETMPHTASLSIIVTSQKFSLLPLEFRNALSDIIVFKSSNKSEINRLKDEVMFDLSPDVQDQLLDEAWKEKYSFLYIKPNMPLNQKYYIKFDLVEFNN